MADFAPPPGPPPPKVPAGWKAVWNDQYKEWFYVNTYTKKSQWDKPTEAVYGSPDGSPPPGAPPSYDPNTARSTSDNKTNNPFLSGNNTAASGSNNISDDERLARQLQDEENAKASATTGTRGASDDFYNSAPAGVNTYPPPAGGYPNTQTYPQDSGTPYAQQQLPPRDAGSSGSRGFLGKLFGKSSSSNNNYGGGGYGRPSQGYGPGPGYGGGYGGYGGGGGYPPPGGYYQQPPPQQQQQHHGLGAGGGAALGLGAGLIGGALLMDGIDHAENNAYDQGYQNGADNGGDGGNYGGGDGGGDFGGGDGGGDFGGGDF